MATIPTSNDEPVQKLIRDVAEEMLYHLLPDDRGCLESLAGGPDQLLAAAMKLAPAYITSSKGLGQKDMDSAVAWEHGLSEAGKSLGDFVPYDFEASETIARPLSELIRSNTQRAARAV